MLRRAGADERIRVTLHGRPVADIVPPGVTADGDRLTRARIRIVLEPRPAPRGR